MHKRILVCFFMPHSVVLKKLRKSVNICQSYRKNKSDTFFMDHGVNSKHTVVEWAQLRKTFRFGLVLNTAL